MKLSRKDYQALKLGADLADAQRLLNEHNFPIADAAAPVIGALVGVLLLFGIGISLVSSEREQGHWDQIASVKDPGVFAPTR
jgi:hypothetical protein